MLNAELKEFTFKSRHIGPTNKDEALMLQRLGFENTEEFISSVIPNEIFDSETRIQKSCVMGEEYGRCVRAALRPKFTLSNNSPDDPCARLTDLQLSAACRRSNKGWRYPRSAPRCEDSIVHGPVIGAQTHGR